MMQSGKGGAKPDWMQNQIGYVLPDWIQSGDKTNARLQIPIWGNRAIGARLEPIGPDCFGSASSG